MSRDLNFAILTSHRFFPVIKFRESSNWCSFIRRPFVQGGMEIPVKLIARDRRLWKEWCHHEEAQAADYREP